jgi:hypothetical protein
VLLGVLKKDEGASEMGVRQSKDVIAERENVMKLRKVFGDCADEVSLSSPWPSLAETGWRVDRC